MAAAIGQELRKSIVEKMKRDNDNNNMMSSPTTITKEEKNKKVEQMKATEE